MPTLVTPPSQPHGSVDIAIVTALEDELTAILDLLGGEDAWKRDIHEKFPVYHGWLHIGEQALAVCACAAPEMGEVATAVLTTLLAPLHPRLLAMTGICAGWREKGIELGDLIIADRAFDPTGGKRIDAAVQPDAKSVTPPPYLLKALQDFKRERAWLQELPHKPLTMRYQIDWLLCQLAERPGFPVDDNDWSAIASNCSDYGVVRDMLIVQNMLSEQTNKLIKRATERRLNQIRIAGSGKLIPKPDHPSITLHNGVFATLNQVTAVSDPFGIPAERDRTVRAIDMEVRGFFAAAAMLNRPAIAMKGVSDFGLPDKDDNFRHFAATVSARGLYAFLRRSWQNFVNELPPPGPTKSPSPLPRRDLLDDAPLRTDTVKVERPELIGQIRQALLGDGTAVALTAAKAAPTALHGMGGIGKTWLAGQICEDRTIYDHFDGGVIWVTVGEAADIRQILTSLVRRLCDDFSEHAPDMSWLQDRLAGFFRERACLLVLDDIWNADHLQAFRMLGPHCRQLVTTRFANIADDLCDTGIRVDILTPAEAITLLEQATRGAVAGTLQETKLQISDLLGYHPLAIRIAGPQIATYGVAMWLQEFRPDDLEDSQRPLAIPVGLFTVLKRSLQYLERDTQTNRLLALRLAYLDLAIFKPDERIPEQAIAVLWQSRHRLARKEVRRYIRVFSDRHLLTLHEQGDQWQVELHDYLHLLVSRELGQEVQAVQGALLDAYATRQKMPGSWASVADDGYLYDHLAYHLAATERWDELWGLFANHNWMHKRVKQSNRLYDGYLTDLNLAWDHAEQDTRAQIEADQDPAAIADCVHFALIRSSINSLSTNYEPALVAQAIAIGLESWTMQRALSITKRIADPRRKAEMAIALLSVDSKQDEVVTALQLVQGKLRGIAFQAVCAITDEAQRSKVLTDLLPMLANDRELLTKTLQAACVITDAQHRSHALVSLAPLLTGVEQRVALAEALQAAFAITEPYPRNIALTKLVPLLSGTERQTVLEGALQGASDLNERDRSQLLITLAPLLHPDHHLLNEALQITYTIADEYSRCQVFKTLVPLFTGNEQTSVLVACLQSANNITSNYVRSFAFVAITPLLIGTERQAVFNEALQTARNIADEDDRSRALVNLAPLLVEVDRQAVLAEALQTARNIADEDDRSRALVNLAPLLVEVDRQAVLAEALQAVRNIADEDDRGRALVNLVPRLVHDQYLLTSALQTTRAIPYKHVRNEVYVVAIPFLAQGEQQALLDEAFQGAHNITYEHTCDNVLASLTYLLAHDQHLINDAIKITQIILNEDARSRALQHIAPLLIHDQHLQSVAAKIAYTIIDNESRSAALESLQLPHVRYQDISKSTHEKGSLFTNEQDYSEDIKAPKHSPIEASWQTDSAEHLQGVQDINNEDLRNLVLGAIISPYQFPIVPTGIQGRLFLSDMLQAASVLADQNIRSLALIRLAPMLVNDQHLFSATLQAVREITNEAERIGIFHVLIHLTEGIQQQMILTEAIRDALTVTDDNMRRQMLGVLASMLEGTERQAIFDEILQLTRALPNESVRATELRMIYSNLDKLQQVNTRGQIRADLLTLLQEKAEGERERVLQLCNNANLVSPPFVALPTIARIAWAIVQVCQEWEWV